MKKNVDLSPILATNLNETVYHVLRKQILNHNFPPGERLDLSVLEDSLNVSRTPLKNALTRLEAEGLVEVQPRRGTYITRISAARIEEAYKIRSAFEIYVALCLFKYVTPEDFDFFDDVRCNLNSLVADKQDNWQSIISEYLEFDRQLHERFVLRGGTSRMVALFQQMNVHMQLLRVAPNIEAHDFDAMHFEHEQIFEALFDHSQERFSAALLNHLEASRIRVLKRLAVLEI